MSRVCDAVLGLDGNGYNPVFSCVAGGLIDPGSPLNGQGRFDWGCPRLFTANAPVNFNNADGFGLATSMAFAASAVALFGGLKLAHVSLSAPVSAKSNMVFFGDLVQDALDEYSKKRLAVYVVFALVFFGALCGILYNGVGPACEEVFVEGVSTNTCNPYIGTPGLNTVGVFTALSFLTGAVLSVCVSVFIKLLAVRASVSVAQAASVSAEKGAAIAMKTSGAIGLATAGVALMGLVICIMVLTIGTYDQRLVWQYLAGFGFGASVTSFAIRVGGGLFAKSASLGVDMASKLKLASASSRNNSGVVAEACGKVATESYGASSAFFESWIGSIIAACILGFSTYSNLNLSPAQAVCLFGTSKAPLFSVQTNYAISAIALPLWQAGLQIVCCIYGMHHTKYVADDSATAYEQEWGLTWRFRQGVLVSFGSYVGLSALISWICFGNSQEEWNVYGSSLIGVGGSMLLGGFVGLGGQKDGYVTSSITESAAKGPVFFVAQSMATAGLMNWVVVGLIVCMLVGANALNGTYGVALAALSMHTMFIQQFGALATVPIVESSVKLGEIFLDEVKPEGLTRIDVVQDSLKNVLLSVKTLSLTSSAMTAVVITFAFVVNSGMGSTGTDFEDPVVLAGGFIGGFLPFLCMSLVLLPLGPMAEHVFLTLKKQVDANPQLYLENASNAPKDLPHVKDMVSSLHYLSIMNLVTPLSLLILTPFTVSFMLGQQALAATLFATIVSSTGVGLSLGGTGSWASNANWQLHKGKAVASLEGEAASLGVSIVSPLNETVAPLLASLMRNVAMLSLVLAPVFRMVNINGTVFQTNSWWFGLLAAGFWFVLVIFPRHAFHGNKHKAARNKLFNETVQKMLSS